MLSLTVHRRSRKERQRQDLKYWRRNRVIELTSKGQSQAEIARILVVGIGTVNRDLTWFRDQSTKKMTKFIEKIQEEHEKSMIGLNAVLKEAWAMSDNAKDSKEKIQALTLAKDCYALREELLCNMPVIDEALKIESDGLEPGRPESFTSDSPISVSPGEKEDDIQRPKEKDRESQNKKTTNKTF